MEDNGKGKAEDKGKEPVKPAADTGEGGKYETTPVIERAREEREKLEAATKAQREENDRTEQIMAKRALGGDSEAGQAPVVNKEETPHEYRLRVNKELAEGKFNDNL